MNPNDFTPEQQEVLAKVEKLMRLAAKNPNEHEAAAASSKAMELLAAYNLTAAAIDIEGESSGKRAEESLIGGFYEFERDLWNSIAALNFVWYFSRVKYIPPDERKFHRGRVHTRQHVMVGKVVNIAATKAMASYLMQAIERIAKEKYIAVNEHPRSSWAVSFRCGMAERIMEKINRKRWQQLEADEKAAAEAAERAAKEGISNVETAITLATVQEREHEANYDFMYGKGAYAKRRREIAENEKRRAEARAKAEAEYTTWAAAHPEEAAKQERQRIARERKAANRRGRSYRAPAFKGDWSAYSMGYEAGKAVGIDPQAEGRKSRGELQ